MRLKRLMAGFLAAVTVVTFVGCGKNEVKNGEVKEYTFFHFNATAPYDAEMPVWKHAEEKTGIRLKNTVADSASDEKVAWTTLLATGELPDIVSIKVDSLRELATDGGLVPLNELIEKHAPNIKKFFEEYPQAVNYSGNGDGNIYFIPCSINNMEIGVSKIYMVRQDWLDKLGLKVPTTIDEYHDMLVAFKTKDPNGNGIADEIPYFDREKGIYGILALYGLPSYASHSGFDKNGEYFFAPITEEYKQAMKTAAQWRKEGLIDEEIFTRNNAREQLFGQNLAGATYDWTISTTGFNDIFAETVPGINIVPMRPVKNTKGDVYSVGVTSPYNNTGWGISTQVSKEDQIEIIKYMDYFMSDEGRDLMSYGIEGLSYTKDENGKLIWSEAALAHETGVMDYLSSIGALNFIGTVRRADVDRSLRSEVGLKAIELYSQDILATPWVQPIYTPEEIKVLDPISENIDTAIKEQQQKWFYGKEDVDATWDAYIKKLESIGLDKYIEIVKTAAERMNK